MQVQDDEPLEFCHSLPTCSPYAILCFLACMELLPYWQLGCFVQQHRSPQWSFARELNGNKIRLRDRKIWALRFK